MISREELRQLASFECQSPNELAISFYFQPSTPQDQSHREEAILAKDLVRKTLQELQLNGRNRDAIEDLEKILHLAEGLHGNQARAKDAGTGTPVMMQATCSGMQVMKCVAIFVRQPNS